MECAHHPRRARHRRAAGLGKTVVLKGSELCPATHGLIVEALQEAGFPQGVANFVTNARADAGAVVEAMVAHPAVRRVNFTGSTQVGKIIDHPELLIFGFGVHGMFVNAVQSTMYALCAYVYPTAVRATGTASALAFGRLGAILSAFAGAAVITTGGASAYLLMLGGAMVLVFVARWTVGRHIPALQGVVARPVLANR